MTEQDKKEFSEKFHHRDGCLFELHEKFDENGGKSSCSCGLDRQLGWIEALVAKRVGETIDIAATLAGNYSWGDIEVKTWAYKRMRQGINEELKKKTP